ncbi:MULTISPECIES: hypothetical protein [unclassified Streptomyces]|uniref:hypothetical protein n=1 Tax=unclassified Streptomyces TaxID=2593676 RepID=UPI002259F7E9|nr:hypothetical protein [Streptomyces sp. NBC_00063]
MFQDPVHAAVPVLFGTVGNGTALANSSGSVRLSRTARACAFEAVPVHSGTAPVNRLQEIDGLIPSCSVCPAAPGVQVDRLLREGCHNGLAEYGATVDADLRGTPTASLPGDDEDNNPSTVPATVKA